MTDAVHVPLRKRNGCGHETTELRVRDNFTVWRSTGLSGAPKSRHGALVDRLGLLRGQVPGEVVQHALAPGRAPAAQSFGVAQRLGEAPGDVAGAGGVHVQAGLALA